MSISTTDNIAGVVLPDTPLVRQVTDFIREAEDDLLFDHSRRVFLFGALQGRRLGLEPDLELLYTAAMFHDLGLTPRYRTSMLRFEVDGANAARDFLLAQGADEADARKVWLAIALHTAPGVPQFLEPEIALVTAGVETDVVGIGRDELSPEDLAAVTAAHPRPDFKRRILQAFTDGMKHRPRTTFGTMNADVLERYDPTFRDRPPARAARRSGQPVRRSRNHVSTRCHRCSRRTERS
ncbi:metal-dependent phosphohydrolase [Mycobacterium noviomagense]|uniref:Metal-dependent phosphohydrolase n=1 Tax=Mycobacterium noviomagense TaxID=459858 RepID=A0A7I7PJW0_9MYCO|nr:metal-dependent phosphohydrolase [Mycobacterium noviomagense]